MDKTKIILVDDHQIVRDGISASLLMYSEIEVVAEAANGKELFILLDSFSPDIIVLDISMPDLSGIEICKKLKADFPEIKVIIFTGDQNQNAIFEALEAGADGFVPKEAPGKDLVDAIHAVNKGENYLSSAISSTVLIDYIKNSKQKKESVELSEREIEVLILITDGLAYKNIAEKLFISTKTVEKHKRNILNKLKLETTIDLVKYAIKNKFIEI